MTERNRNIAAMQESPRCTWRTRTGEKCKAPAMKDDNRCWVHGGDRKGPPRGNKNALKHGALTGEERRRRRDWANWRKEALAFLADAADKSAEVQATLAERARRGL